MSAEEKKQQLAELVQWVRARPKFKDLLLAELYCVISGFMDAKTSVSVEEIIMAGKYSFSSKEYLEYQFVMAVVLQLVEVPSLFMFNFGTNWDHLPFDVSNICGELLPKTLKNTKIARSNAFLK